MCSHKIILALSILSIEMAPDGIASGRGNPPLRPALTVKPPTGSRGAGTITPAATKAAGSNGNRSGSVSINPQPLPPRTGIFVRIQPQN